MVLGKVGGKRIGFNYEGVVQRSSLGKFCILTEVMATGIYT